MTRLATSAAFFFLACGQACAATFVKADVTTLLGPTFFVDDAAAGGTDVTLNQPDSGSYVRSFAGLLTPYQGTTTVTITGLGFATSTSAASNNATSIMVTFTYLGADGVVGGGDDAVIGDATCGYTYASDGEYACRFDTPLVATLNITAINFLVTVKPTNAGGDGAVLVKEGTIPFDGTTGPKLSVAGTVSGALPAKAQRVNLAKYQVTTASSEDGQYIADFATDGVVGNDNSWRSSSRGQKAWAEVTLAVPATVRSAQLYSGIDDGNQAGDFEVQYFSGGSWVVAPGSTVANNTLPERNVIFSSSVTSNRFRFSSTAKAIENVKEFALFPPNPAPGTGAEQGYPIGTDVEINLAKRRPAVASATSGTHYAKLAVDGFVSSSSKWETSTTGTNTLDIDLCISTKIRSAHLYSGDGALAPIENFTLQYWNGSEWTNIPGGTVSGNTSASRVVAFSSSVIASMVRLTFNNPSVSAVRELCIFPANGGTNYPIGTDVLGTAPPSMKFDDYNDAFYHVINHSANLPISVNGSTPVLDPGALDVKLGQYQALLNVGTETYRLRNRNTGRCLAGAGVSKTGGAVLVDEDYTGMPHQNWRLIPVDGTDYYLMNDWSGLVVDTQLGASSPGTALVQQTINGSITQHWRFVLQTHYPKKGLAGYVDQWSAIKGSWAYNWGRTTAEILPAEVVFNPMQWGDYNWYIGSNQGPLEQFISPWQREEKAMYLMGFNEPDKANQANLTVARAISLWPRVERMDTPLVSPAPASSSGTWMDDFMNQAQALGYRMDAVAAHTYPGPGGGSSNSLVTMLQNLNSDWGRPVWLTEFSTVDWNGTGAWTEEDNYNWLAEFMWRAESLSWLRRYSLFLFTADATHPEPTNPWEKVAPRSNAFQSDGTTPTAFGELYFAWDGDANVREDKAYFIHNRGERKRIRNAMDSIAPDYSWIRDGGDTVQWLLHPSDTAGQWYITSLRDGRRLRYSGATLDFAPANTTGPSVRWSLVENQYGWYYIENPSAPDANRRLQLSGGVFSMVISTTTTDQAKWRFVVPYSPVQTSVPSAVQNLSAIAGDAQVSLTWSANTSPDFAFYSVYRSTTSGGPYTLVAANIYSTSYTDTTAPNGMTYYYVVTATNLIGFESALSSQSVAAPLASAAPSWFGISHSAGIITVTWPATHLGWNLESQPNGLSPNGWSTVPDSTTTTSYSEPVTPSSSPTFYRLRHP
jgi:hypothetical protein